LAIQPQHVEQLDSPLAVRIFLARRIRGQCLEFAA
jgi:hypothetical protein